MAIRQVGSTKEATVTSAALSHLLLLPASMVPFVKVSRHHFFADDFLTTSLEKMGLHRSQVTSKFAWKQEEVGEQLEHCCAIAAFVLPGNLVATPQHTALGCIFHIIFGLQAGLASTPYT